MLIPQFMTFLLTILLLYALCFAVRGDKHYLEPRDMNIAHPLDKHSSGVTCKKKKFRLVYDVRSMKIIYL